MGPNLWCGRGPGRTLPLPKWGNFFLWYWLLVWQFSTKNIVRQAEERLKLKTAVFKLCDPAPSTTYTSYHSGKLQFHGKREKNNLYLFLRKSSLTCDFFFLSNHFLKFTPTKTHFVISFLLGISFQILLIVILKKIVIIFIWYIIWWMLPTCLWYHISLLEWFPNG